MSADGQAAGSDFGAATRAVMPQSDVCRLFLLRHGEVASFADRLVRGQIDLPLSERGIEQHNRLVEWIARGNHAIDLILTSDLMRCRDLGERLARATGAPLEDVPALREQAMGAWEGLPWDEVSRREGPAINAYWNDYFHAAPPGGESMESMFERIAELWRDRSSAWAGRNIAVVTHVGPLRAFMCHLFDLPGSQSLRFAPAIASCTQVIVAAAGAVINTFGERPWSFTASPRPTKQRCIALSGSAGTGKTTLARALAERLELPYIEEGMRERLERGLDLHALDLEGMRRLNRELWQEQRDQERDAVARCGGYVADRSHADFAAFWLHYGLFDDEAATARFMADTRAAATDGEFVVLLPHGRLPLVNDGVRSTNPWMQLRFQLLVEGLITRWVPSDRQLRFDGGEPLEERVRSVLERVGV